jgi:hypothetical protein
VRNTIIIIFILYIFNSSLFAWYKSFKGAVISPGINTGFQQNDNSIAGCEISLFVFKDLTYFGIMTECIYNFETNSPRYIIGPEIGFFIFGLDGGIVINQKNKESGYSIRPYCAIPVVIYSIRNDHEPNFIHRIMPFIYYRYTKFADSKESEVGILIKMLFPIKK